jgi:hypothetical protein
MQKTVLVVVLAALATAGCEDRRKAAVERIAADEAIVRKAGAAVNEVVRNAADCEIAKPLMVEAYQAIEDARAQATVAASQATLGALKSQVDRVQQACP